MNETTIYPVPVLTLGQIRSSNPHAFGWNTLLNGLGQRRRGYDPTIEVTFGDIAYINGAARSAESGVVESLRCLRCLPLEEARFWAHTLVSPAVERAKQRAESVPAARPTAVRVGHWAALAGAAAKVEGASRAAHWGAVAAAANAEDWGESIAKENAAAWAAWEAEVTGKAATSFPAGWAGGVAWQEERRAQLEDIMRLCPALHSQKEENNA